MSCVWMLQRGHSGDGCVLASTLCKYDLRKGDLFVLSWARVRRVRRGSIPSTVTALHTVNNTGAKGFNQMAPHVRTYTHLIRKLLQTPTFHAQSLSSSQTTSRDAQHLHHTLAALKRYFTAPLVVPMPRKPQANKSDLSCS